MAVVIHVFCISRNSSVSSEYGNLADFYFGLREKSLILREIETPPASILPLELAFLSSVTNSYPASQRNRLSRTMAAKHGAAFRPEVPVLLTRQDNWLSLFYGCLCTALVVYIQTLLPEKAQPGYRFSAAPRTAS